MWQQAYVPLSVNKREQQLYQDYLTQLRLKDRKFFHTLAGTVGPLERGLIKATNSGENFGGWVGTVCGPGYQVFVGSVFGPPNRPMVGYSQYPRYHSTPKAKATSQVRFWI